MIISKKLLLATFGLYISFNVLAMDSSPKESIHTRICDFNVERDTQPIIDIANKEHHRLWDGVYTAYDYQAYLLKCHNNPACNLKILQENEKLAGYVVYKKSGLDGGYIEQVAVSDNFRNKGYGKLLTSTALQELHDMDAHSTHLLCYKDNIPAFNLYGKMGFKKYWEGNFNDRNIVVLKHSRYPLIHTCISEKLPTEVFDQPWNY